MPLIWMEAGLLPTWLMALWPATPLITGEPLIPHMNIFDSSSFSDYLFLILASTSDSRWRCSRDVATVLCVHQRLCQPTNCSEHGECVDGSCQCEEGWQGAACDTLVCQPPACGPHGFCTASECTSTFIAAAKVSSSCLWNILFFCCFS